MTTPRDARMATIQPRTSMKRTVIVIVLFLIATILVPICAWIFLDLEGSELSELIGYMIFVGLALGGWLGWTLLVRAFFKH